MADNDLNLNCPACGKPMKKVFISSANCNVDVCIDGCGGIFFDNRELDKINKIEGDIVELTEIFKDKDFAPVNTSQVRVCPYCKHNMVKNFASVKYEVEIDQCYSCGGVFLDFNELFQIRKQYKNDEERSRDFNQKFLSKFGEELMLLDESKSKSGLSKQIFDKVFNSIYYN